MAVHVDQRTTGVAGIDCRIGLDEELIVRHADFGARQRRDDTVCHSLSNAERIADRQHHIADQKLVGIAEIESWKALPRALEPQHRKIAALVLQNNLGAELAL